MSNIQYGTNADETLTGGKGIDFLLGGEGNDTYMVNHVGDIVLERGNAGSDNVFSSVSYSLDIPLRYPPGYQEENTQNTDTSLNEIDNSQNRLFNPEQPVTEIENLTLLGSKNINATGNYLNNRLVGNRGANILDGRQGADIMQGDVGNDTYIVDHVDDQVIEQEKQGTDTVQSYISYTLGDHLEKLTLLGDDDLTAFGNSLNNVIIGNNGHNILSGQGGKDTLQGGLGNDRYLVNDTTTKIVELVKQGDDTVVSTVSYTLGKQLENLELDGENDLTAIGNELNNLLIGNYGNNTLDGKAGNDFLYGATGNDSLLGGANNDYLLDSDGDDTLVGGTGNDTMEGGEGSDTYWADNFNDQIIEKSNDNGIDTLIYTGNTAGTLDLNTAQWANLEHVFLRGKADIHIFGNNADNELAGNNGNEVFYGGNGNDTLTGGKGNDRLSGGNGNDIYIFNAGDGIDTIDVGEGSDILKLGKGITLGTIKVTILETWLILAFQKDKVIFTNNKNSIKMLQFFDGTLLNEQQIRALIQDSRATNGNDRLDGTRETNHLDAGPGNDVYIIKDSSSTVSEKLAGKAGGIDTVYSPVSFILSSNIEHLYLTGNEPISGSGNELNNRIVANDAGNELMGGGGKDTLIGGAGNDTYFVKAGDVVIEKLSGAAGGIDWVVADCNWTLGPNLENLSLYSWYSEEQLAQIGIGNNLDNRINGNELDNTLDGGLGNDTLNGLWGNDTYIIDSIDDVVIEEKTISENGGIDTVLSSVTYTLSPFVEQLILTGKGNIQGTGNELDNLLAGNTGNNTLIGGLGNDVYVVQNAGDRVVEAANEGNDTVQTTLNWVLEDQIENLELLGKAAKGTGNALNNRLLGNAAANTLDGGEGRDTMDGLGGNDAYFVDSEFDVVFESLDGKAGGVDTVFSTDNYQLRAGSNIENLTLVGKRDVNISGNELNNLMVGNNNNNSMDGGSGNDTLNGGDGNDCYFYADGWGLDKIIDSSGVDQMDLSAVTANLTVNLVAGTGNEITDGTNTVNWTGNVIENLITGTGNDTVTGTASDNVISSGSGNDSVSGGDGNDILDGGLGNDTLRGGNGNDTLFGGEGKDSLDGGLGNDTYVILANYGTDTITDAGGSDTFDFSTFSSNVNVSLSGTSIVGSGTITWSANAMDNLITGTGHDYLNGNAQANLLSGGDGNDTLIGLAGDDTLNGGLGNDSYLYADNFGTDLIIDAGGADKLDFNLVNGTMVYNMVTGIASRGSISVNFTPGEIEQIIGSASHDLFMGSSTAETFNGGTGNDTISGGAGNDLLQGGGGNDIYRFSYGDGVDTISDSGNTDTLVFENAVSLESVVFFQSGGNLQIGYTNTENDVITIQGQTTSGTAIERFELSTGQFMTNSELNQVIADLAAYASTNSISLTSLEDVKNDSGLMSIVNAGWHL